MFTIGQKVIAKNSRQNTSLRGGVVPTRKIMEIASVIPNYEDRPGVITTAYKLRKPGSDSKGGQIIWPEATLEAI